MNFNSAPWSIFAASLVSVGLIGGAYLFAKGDGHPRIAQASTETALLQQIATRDSTGDGLPDWEKALYGIPLNATTTDYFHLGMTDGEAVAKGLIVPKAIADIPVATSSPTTLNGVDYAADGLTAPTSGSLTDIFANDFFALYLNAKENNGGQELSATDIQNLEDEAMNDLQTSVSQTPDFKSARDLTVSGTGNTALVAFAQNAETIFKKNASTATKDEISYLQDVLENDDASALTQIESIAKADREAATGIAVLPVPQELKSADLELVNALMHMSQIVNDFSRVNTDPLTTVLALEQYQQASLALAHAFADVGNVYSAAGVSLPQGTTGATFLTVAAHAAGTTAP